MRPGVVEWIGLRPNRRGVIDVEPSALLVAGRGIKGDHYRTDRNGARQVTLIAVEDISAIASFLGRADISADLLRRNFVTRGINLPALKGRKFRMGEAVLEWSGDCAPCSRMEDALGTGGYNAVRGRGGITARILEGGTVRVGDRIAAIA
jgi:MOSC domain-containing protein YiiM